MCVRTGEVDLPEGRERRRTDLDRLRRQENLKEVRSRHIGTFKKGRVIFEIPGADGGVEDTKNREIPI